METKVTPEDFKRDLMMDLLLAEAATPGPWVYIINGYGEGRVGPAEPRWGDESVGQAFWLTSSVWVMSGSDEARASNTKFVAAAREGWPAAIRLALHYRKRMEHYMQRLAASGKRAQLDRAEENARTDEHLTLCESEADRYQRLREEVRYLLNACGRARPNSPLAACVEQVRALLQAEENTQTAQGEVQG